MIDKEMKVGFNSHRLVDGDPYYAEEINFVEKINDEMKFSTNMLAGIVRHGERKGYNYLTEDEEKIVMSVIQWLGTPVGVGFLYKCGYEKVKENEHNVNSSLLLDDTKLKQLIWEDWENEIKEGDPREMVFKYMKLMRKEIIKK